VAGVTCMTRRRFTIFDVTGAALWIASVTLLGYGIGNLPWVKTHLQWIFLAMIIIPGVGALIGILRKKAQPAA
jgi:membrane-associated protein